MDNQQRLLTLGGELIYRYHLVYSNQDAVFAALSWNLYHLNVEGEFLSKSAFLGLLRKANEKFIPRYTDSQLCELTDSTFVISRDPELIKSVIYVLAKDGIFHVDMTVVEEGDRVIEAINRVIKVLVQNQKGVFLVKLDDKNFLSIWGTLGRRQINKYFHLYRLKGHRNPLPIQMKTATLIHHIKLGGNLAPLPFVETKLPRKIGIGTTCYELIESNLVV